MHRLVRFVVTLALVGLSVCVGWLLLHRRGTTAGGTTEQTYIAERLPMEDVLVVSGQVRPAVTIDIRAEASGIVEHVAVKEGDRVVTGQELVRLDSRLAQSALDHAEAALRLAELQDAATRLDADEDSAAFKRRTLERSKALYAAGLLARDQLEQDELDLRVSERALERARRNIDSSHARIVQARAAVTQARTQLQHTIIRAPFDAFVLRRLVEVGSGVAGVSQSSMGGTVLMTLGGARQSALYAKATASDARRLRIGLTARVHLDSDPSEPVLGDVASISTAGDVDQSTKLTTFPLVIALRAQPPGGWVNIPAQAEIVLGVSTPSISVPERCVRTRPNGRSYVVVQTPTGARHYDVEVGALQGDRIQIRTGLDRGQVVVCQTP